MVAASYHSLCDDRTWRIWLPYLLSLRAQQKGGASTWSLRGAGGGSLTLALHVCTYQVSFVYSLPIGYWPSSSLPFSMHRLIRRHWVITTAV
jgi:hypothetical protein